MPRLFLALALLVPAAAQAQYLVLGGNASSARQTAASGAASFLPTDDPHGFHFNPALLPGARDGVTGSFARVPYGYVLDTPTHAAALVSGRDAQVGGLPLRVGVGASYVQQEYVSLATDHEGNEVGEFLQSERAVSLGIGAETQGPVRLALGASTRYYRGTYGIEGERTRSGGLAASVGLLGTADLAALAGAGGGGVIPVAEVSVGYAQRNIGPSVDFEFRLGDESQAYQTPLPRQAALGWSAVLGTDVMAPGGRVPAVRVSANVEGVGSLVEGRGFEDDYGYDPFLGPLRLGHALTGRGRYDVVDCGTDCTAYQDATGHRAATLEIADAVSFTLASRQFGSEEERRASWGIGVDVAGALRTVGAVQNDASLRALGERLGLRVDYARVLHNEEVFFLPDAPQNALTFTLGWRP